MWHAVFPNTTDQFRLSVDARWQLAQEPVSRHLLQGPLQRRDGGELFARVFGHERWWHAISHGLYVTESVPPPPGALIPSSIAYLFRRRMAAPVTAPEFQVPESRGIDRRLIAGAVMFGLGWGLVGLCPGPAIAALTTGAWQVSLFVAAMLVGMGLFRLTLDRPAAFT